MSRRCRFKFRRWMQSTPLLRHARVMVPVLFVLSVSAVAHAQGTMDFSGAQTLMGTFNARTSAVEIQVELSHAIQFVAEKPICTVRCQRAGLLEASYHIGRRAASGTSQVRDEVSYLLLASVVRKSLPIARSLYLPMELTDMFNPSNDVCRDDRAIHSEGFS